MVDVILRQDEPMWPAESPPQKLLPPATQRPRAPRANGDEMHKQEQASGQLFISTPSPRWRASAAEDWQRGQDKGLVDAADSTAFIAAAKTRQ
jgi:hypothetical protein